MGSAPFVAIQMSPSVQASILLVDDELIPRRELKRALMKQGMKVLEASDSEGALREARSEEISLVLMDILLGDGPDGIEAACMIRDIQPNASFIFLSAVAGEQEYHDRAVAHNLPVTEWIEKPIQPALPQLFETISRGLASAPSSRPEGDEESEVSVDIAIDAVYSEMRALVESHVGGGLREALQPLREKLRTLQIQEAHAIAERYNEHFRLDNERAENLIMRARKVLDQ